MENFGFEDIYQSLKRLREGGEKEDEEEKEKVKEEEVVKRGEEKRVEDKKLYFCGVCGKRVDIDDIGGKCNEVGCEMVICNECWESGRRYCKEHEKGEEEYASDDDLLNIDDSSVKLVKNLMIEYKDFIEKRFKERGAIDFLPGEFLNKVKFKIKDEHSRFIVEIFKKKMFFRKAKKLNITVRPMLLFDYDVEKEVEQWIKMEEKVYNVFVFVSHSRLISRKLVDVFENYKGKGCSIFLVDMEKKRTYYNDKGFTKYIASWVGVEKTPMDFLSFLRNIAEVVNDRLVVSAKVVGEELGIDEKSAMEMLKPCKFLSWIKGTDTFIFY